MFTFVASDEKGQLCNAQQRRVRGHVLRKRQRPGPDELDERRSFRLPLPARDRIHRFKIAGYEERKKERLETRDSWTGGSHGLLIPAQQTRPSLKAQPYLFPRFSLPVDSEGFSILSTYLPRCIGMCSLGEMGFERDIDNSCYRDWLVMDMAYGHSAMALSCAAQNGLYGRKLPGIVWFHTAKAISCLNSHLSDPILAARDSTIATIITLGATAAFSGDYTAASEHISGLWLLIRRRGGIDSLRNNPHLIVSIFRLDLNVSLGSGQPGFVHRDPFLPNSTFLRSPHASTPHFSYEQDLQGLIDQRLVCIFHEMHLLARDVNMSNMGDKTVPESDFCHSLFPSQCSLLLLRNQLNTSLDECVRLTLLALHSTMWDRQGSRANYQYTGSRIGKLCQTIETTSPPQLQELMLWILMLGLVSNMLDYEAEWLRSLWQRELGMITQGVKWLDVRRKLKGFIWIDSCHDELGKFYFEGLYLNS